MTKTLSPNEIRALPVDARLQLIEDLWESLDEEKPDLSLSSWREHVIEERLRAFNLGTASGEQWEIVRERIGHARGKD